MAANEIRMSYDLAVFDPSSAPRDRKEFIEWYVRKIESPEEDHGDNPKSLTRALQAWFREMVKIFPPLNGPLAPKNLDSPKLTDYSLAGDFVFISFRWSEEKEGYERVKTLAAKHGLGFFDASGQDGDIFWPVPGWTLSSEKKEHVPMPADLAFEPVLKNLDAKNNSFYILSHESGNYMQCGGSRKQCTVEYRVFDRPNKYDKYKHYVVGHTNGSTAPAHVKMSEGVINLHKGEVLDYLEAAELFELFSRGKKFPKKYAIREKDI